MNRGLLLVISGSSGAGKSTVISELMKLRDDLCFSVSATTRPPRPGEEDGKNYHFVSREKFQHMLETGGLLEHAEYVNNYYGTPAEPIERNLSEGKCVILEIEIKGAAQIREKRPEAVHIFLTPGSFSELRRRLEGRNTEPPEILEMRINAAKEEYLSAAEYDYIVINDDVGRAAQEINAIITAGKCRVENRLEGIMTGLCN